jgi:hypothetical protein
LDSIVNVAMAAVEVVERCGVWLDVVAVGGASLAILIPM